MAHREFKGPLYAEFARIGHAVASPKRLELLDLLSQGEKTVEALAEQSATPIKNTSAHLRVLRQALLVETRREGTFVRYRLAHDDVSRFLRSLQELGRQRLAEVERIATSFLDARDQIRPVSLAELDRLMGEDAVTVIDVRPRDEYDAGHISGALSVPVPALRGRLSGIPKRKEVIAYCRGPFCVYSLEAVLLLRKRGYRARRAASGFPDWKAEGFAFEPKPLLRSGR